jgi:hypothetical protein
VLASLLKAGMKIGPFGQQICSVILFAERDENCALALVRQLGVSWNAAWRLKQKLMEVMAQRQADCRCRRYQC